MLFTLKYCGAGVNLAKGLVLSIRKAVLHGPLEIISHFLDPGLSYNDTKVYLFAHYLSMLI